MLSDSKETPPLTEKQLAYLKELEAKPNRTDKQDTELAELILKRQKNLQGDISATHMEYLLEVYAYMTEDMVSVSKELMYIPAIEKGKELEPDGALLLSKVTGKMFRLHKQIVSNDYLTGEVDLFEGEDIMEARCIADVKNAYDYVIFLKKTKKSIESRYDKQIKGYMNITGAKEGLVGDVLCSFTKEMRDDAILKLMRKYNVVSEEAANEQFQEARYKLTRSMYYEDMDERLRVNTKAIEPFSGSQVQKVQDRVKISRDWLNNFHNERLKLLK